ncbi:hypothetical protein BD779DRAFT_1513096 [Infundibulicybe gibba]|nr:hypothetical protein BD779DRAFT_1513096 [Infundibulicybe gibba]
MFNIPLVSGCHRFPHFRPFISVSRFPWGYRSCLEFWPRSSGALQLPPFEPREPGIDIITKCSGTSLLAIHHLFQLPRQLALPFHSTVRHASPYFCPAISRSNPSNSDHHSDAGPVLLSSAHVSVNVNQRQSPTWLRSYSTSWCCLALQRSIMYPLL